MMKTKDGAGAAQELVSVKLPRREWRRMRLEAIRRDRTLAALVAEAVREWLDRNAEESGDE
jgi:hypothetical protein